MVQKAKYIAVLIALLILKDALCYFWDVNMFGGNHVVARDTTYSFDTTLIELPTTESKDVAGSHIDTVVQKEIVTRWRSLGYDTTFIILRDSVIKLIERDPFALVLAFNDSLKWRNSLTVVLPQGREDIKDSGYLYVRGHADFLTGIVHFDPIRSSPFKAVTVDKTETTVREKRDWLSVSLYAEKGVLGKDQEWQFGARARVYLGDIIGYATGDSHGDLVPGSKVGIEYLLFRK